MRVYSLMVYLARELDWKGNRVAILWEPSSRRTTSPGTPKVSASKYTNEVVKEPKSYYGGNKISIQSVGSGYSSTCMMRTPVTVSLTFPSPSSKPKEKSFTLLIDKPSTGGLQLPIFKLLLYKSSFISELFWIDPGFIIPSIVNVNDDAVSTDKKLSIMRVYAF